MLGEFVRDAHRAFSDEHADNTAARWVRVGERDFGEIEQHHARSLLMKERRETVLRDLQLAGAAEISSRALDGLERDAVDHHAS